MCSGNKYDVGEIKKKKKMSRWNEENNAQRNIHL